MKNGTFDNHTSRGMAGFGIVLFCVLLLFPGIACAGQYHFRVKQMGIEGKKKSIEFDCSSKETVCKAVLLIIAEGEVEESEMQMDFLVGKDYADMQFLWKGKYLSVNEGTFMRAPLEAKEAAATYEAFLFLPLRNDPYETPEAVIRNGGKKAIATLNIQITRQ